MSEIILQCPCPRIGDCRRVTAANSIGRRLFACSEVLTDRSLSPLLAHAGLALSFVAALLILVSSPACAHDPGVAAAGGLIAAVIALLLAAAYLIGSVLWETEVYVLNLNIGRARALTTTLIANGIAMGIAIWLLLQRLPWCILALPISGLVDAAIFALLNLHLSSRARVLVVALVANVLSVAVPTVIVWLLAAR